MTSKKLKQANNYSLKLISQYSRTIFEIQKKLKSKYFSPEIVQQTIQFLKDNNYLDDKEYAQQWLEFQLKNRPCGKALCYKKLKQKRVSTDIIDQVLKQKYPEEKEQQILEKLAIRKSKELRSYPKKKKFNKLANYLKSKGFSTHLMIDYFEKFKIYL